MLVRGTRAGPRGFARCHDIERWAAVPDVVDVTVSRSGEQFSFAVTVSSPYDTPGRYADAFRVRVADGTVYGVHELDHDHATEQPFTRSMPGVDVPAGVTSVVVEGRDQANGWGGATRTVDLPR